MCESKKKKNERSERDRGWLDRGCVYNVVRTGSQAGETIVGKGACGGEGISTGVSHNLILMCLI
jgi:hypothetical protein